MSEIAARVARLRAGRGAADESVWRWELAWALVDLLAETEDLEPEDVRELLEHADWMLARDRDAGALQLAGLARSVSFALTQDPADGAHATGYLEEALTLIPVGDEGRAELLYQLAIEYLTQEGDQPAPGPLGRIIGCLGELFALQDDPEVRGRLGLAVGFRSVTDPAHAGEVDRAVELMEPAYELVGDSGLRADLSRSLAWMHDTRGDLDAAAEWVRRTLTEPSVAGSPLEVRAHRYLGELLVRSFAPPPGEVDLAAAVRLTRDLPANLGRIQEARRHLSLAAAAKPGDQDVAALLSMLAIAEAGFGGDPADATATVRVMADRLPAGDPRRAQMVSLSAALQEEADPVLGAGPELDARIEDLRKAVADLPEGDLMRPWLLSRLGAALGQRGAAFAEKRDCEEAMALLATAIAEMPAGNPLRARTFVLLAGTVLTALRVDPMGADLDGLLTAIEADGLGLDTTSAHGLSTVIDVDDLGSGIGTTSAHGRFATIDAASTHGMPVGSDVDDRGVDAASVHGMPVASDVDDLGLGIDAASVHVVFGSAYVARAARDSSAADYDRGITHLRKAIDAYRPEDPLRVPLLFMAATAMADRYGGTRDLALLDAAGHYLDEVDRALEASGTPEYAPGTLDRRAAWLLRVTVSFNQYLGRRDPATAARMTADLERVAALTPPGHPDLPLISTLRAWAHGILSLNSGDPRAMAGALDQLMAAASGAGSDPLHGRALRGQAGLAAVLKGLTAGDRGLLDQGIQTLTEVVAAPDAYLGETGTHRYVLGSALIQRSRVGGQRGDLDQGIAHLEAVIRDRRTGPLEGVYPILLVDLAQAYRLKGDPRAVDTGLRALRERLADVLLQTGAERGLATAKAVRDDALETVHWALADGWPEAAVEALELGRAMILRAATAGDALPGVLRAHGHGELADEWQNHLATEQVAAPWEMAAVEVGPEGRIRTPGLMIPGDLRHRVLAAIEDTSLAELLTPPGPAEIAQTLREAGRDAFVYLLPRSEFGPGRALSVLADGKVTTTVLPQLDAARNGRVDRYQRAQNELVSAVDRERDELVSAVGRERDEPDSTVSRAQDEPVSTVDRERRGPVSAVSRNERGRALARNELGRAAELAKLRWRHALDEVCDWAGEVAMTSILEEIEADEPSIVLVPGGTLGIVPWHAARVPAEESLDPGAPGAPGRVARVSAGLRGDGRVYACQRAMVSYAASGRQFVAAAGRPVVGAGRDVVLVSGPDLAWAG
ncbi:hypothetical protein, partial [Acrocarpospora corrugata]